MRSSKAIGLPVAGTNVIVTPAMGRPWRGVVMDPQSFADDLARTVGPSAHHVFVRCVDPGQAVALVTDRVYLVLALFVTPVP